MSEEIAKQTAETNNIRLDKTPAHEGSESRASDYDEIGEEFDFRDSDLDCDTVKATANVKGGRTPSNNNVRLTEDTAPKPPTKTVVIQPATAATTSQQQQGAFLSATANASGQNSTGELLEKTVNSQSVDDDVIVESDSKTETKIIELTCCDSQNAEGHDVDANDDDDDDGDYYSDDPEPDDELIVQFLGEANRIAEARLTARRQARAEAREIRLLELERQQNDKEHHASGMFEMSELKEAEERFRKAMIANAQLDNERASKNYQIQHLKDELEEIGEAHAQVLRELKEKTHDCSTLKRNLENLNEELKLVHGQLQERDALIVEHGLVIIAVENNDGTDAKRTLISTENAQLLSSVQGSLDVRLKRFNEEKQQLRAEIQLLRDQLDHYKTKDKERLNHHATESDDEFETQREANKIISDYKFRLQKAEQDIAALQANLARSETQLLRYKSAAEAAEKAESELKGERRKLQRENREAIDRLEELETENKHLLKRLDKLKNAKSALLKEL